MPKCKGAKNAFSTKIQSSAPGELVFHCFAMHPFRSRSLIDRDFFCPGIPPYTTWDTEASEPLVK